MRRNLVNSARFLTDLLISLSCFLFITRVRDKDLRQKQYRGGSSAEGNIITHPCNTLKIFKPWSKAAVGVRSGI